MLLMQLTLGGFIFTPEELRQTEIFSCLDEAECARLAQTAADVRLEPGDWLARSGETPWFYVIFEGRLRVVIDVHGRQTEFAEHEFKKGEFLGEVPILLGAPFFASKPRAASAAWISNSSST
jgi:thioredoxin reductase (NADPH)